MRLAGLLVVAGRGLASSPELEGELLLLLPLLGQVAVLVAAGARPPAQERHLARGGARHHLHPPPPLGPGISSD